MQILNLCPILDTEVNIEDNGTTCERDPDSCMFISVFVKWHRINKFKVSPENWFSFIVFQYQLGRAINKVQNARKTLSNSHGKHPDDSEVAKFTGLSLAKIESADKCLRVVASSDQPIGESLNAKYLVWLP